MTAKVKVSKRRTVGDWLRERYVNYDPKIHQVCINDVPIDNQRLSQPLGQLDTITLITKPS